MAKPLYVYTGSQWVPVASELESTSTFATQTYADNAAATLGGLVHINTVNSGGAVAAFSVDNVFSSTYDNYKIIISDVLHASSAPINLSFRLRVSGSDESGNTYGYQLAILNNTTTSFQRVQPANAAYIADIGNAAKSNIIIDIFAPFLAARTDYMANNTYQGSSTVVKSVQTWGGNSNTTSYTGFTLLGASGNITVNQVSVFGYRK